MCYGARHPFHDYQDFTIITQCKFTISKLPLQSILFYCSLPCWQRQENSFMVCFVVKNGCNQQSVNSDNWLVSGRFGVSRDLTQFSLIHLFSVFGTMCLLRTFLNRSDEPQCFRVKCVSGFALFILLSCCSCITLRCTYQLVNQFDFISRLWLY